MKTHSGPSPCLLDELTDLRNRCEDKTRKLEFGEYNQWHDAVLDLAAVERTIKMLHEEQTHEQSQLEDIT